MRKNDRRSGSARRQARWWRVAVVVFAVGSACLLFEAPASAVGDPALDQLIAASPVPGWTALPSSTLQPLVTYEDKLLSDVVGQPVTSAVQGWQGADPSERLIVFLVRTPQPVPDADRQAREAVISGCASSTGNAPGGPVQAYASIPGSQEGQCTGVNAIGQAIAGTSMAWVKGNVMVFLEGVGLPQDQVESIAVGQDAAIPANGVQEGGSRTVLIMCLVIAVVAAGVPLFVIVRRRTRRSAPVGPWPADSFQHSQYASPPYPVPVDASTPHASTPHASTPYASTPHASTGPVAVPPGWRPDPTGRYEQRYWSGAAWTEHVYSQGRSGYDLLTTPTSTALAAAPAAIPPLVWRDPNHVRDAGSPSSGENQDHPR